MPVLPTDDMNITKGDQSSSNASTPSASGGADNASTPASSTGADAGGTGNTSGNRAGGNDAPKASAQDHQATPGPVMTEDIGAPVPKEELQARAKELNK